MRVALLDHVQSESKGAHSRCVSGELSEPTLCAYNLLITLDGHVIQSNSPCSHSLCLLIHYNSQDTLMLELMTPNFTLNFIVIVITC